MLMVVLLGHCFGSDKFFPLHIFFLCGLTYCHTSRLTIGYFSTNKPNVAYQIHLMASFQVRDHLHTNYAPVWAILRLLCGDCILKSRYNRAGYSGRIAQVVG